MMDVKMYSFIVITFIIWIFLSYHEVLNHKSTHNSCNWQLIEKDNMNSSTFNWVVKLTFINSVQKAQYNCYLLNQKYGCTGIIYALYK